MATVSGTRTDVSGKPTGYQTQTMSVSRSNASREPGAKDAASYKSRMTREKTSSKSHHISPAKTSGAIDHQISVQPSPDATRPLPNGPGPLNTQGEKSSIVELLQNNKNVSTSRQSRKDGTLTKTIGHVSINSTQGFGKGHVDLDKISPDKLPVSGYRPPRSSSSVNISASSTRAIAMGDLSTAFAYPQHVDDLKLSRRNMNSSNDKLELAPSSDRGVRPKAREGLNSSATPKKLSGDKSYDQTESRGSFSMIKSGQQQQQQQNGSNTSLSAMEQFDANLQLGSKSGRSRADYKLERNSHEIDDSATLGASKVQNLDLRQQLDSLAGLTGLQNLGNTCFMNSILQCLSNTRALLEFCLCGNFTAQINTVTSNMKGTMIKAYARLMEEMWRSGGSSLISSAIAPTDFKYHISRYSRHFVGTREHDAHEFLVYLLEGLHEDINRVRAKKKRFIDTGDQVETISATNKARLSWERYVECDNSAIIDIFMGQLRSALTCQKCGYISNTFEPFLALSLPIKQAGSQVSLYDCFKLFSNEETLDGDNKPKCAKCCTRNACTKQMSIQKFPKVLIIHLMRFKQGTSSKLNTQVSCPLVGLDLSQFTTVSNCTNATYSLYAVSNHSGTPLTGHYTAYARHPYSKQWHVFNDSRVSGISLTNVNSSEAYLLFYELQEPSLSS